MNDDGWPTDWLRGTLSLLVLARLSSGPTYGYAVSASLEERGLGKVKGGTLYPLLTRLESEGLIASHWEPGEGGPGRKVFEVTAAGRAHLALSTRRWAEFSDVVSSVLNDSTTRHDRTRS